MRERRKLKQGAKYHVTARANRGEMIYGSSELKSMLPGVVKKARKKYKFVIQNFCLMGNHIQGMTVFSKEKCEKGTHDLLTYTLFSFKV